MNRGWHYAVHLSPENANHPSVVRAMAKSVLSRYLDPVVLSRISGQRIEPRGLVVGNLAGDQVAPLRVCRGVRRPPGVCLG